MKCDEIKSILTVRMHNVAEAREKINKAYQWREKHHGIADWYRSMAATHLDFNVGAMQMVKNGLQEVRNEHGHNADMAAAHRAMGRCEAYEEWLEQIGPESAEVKAMIDGYGR